MSTLEQVIVNPDRFVAAFRRAQFGRRRKATVKPKVRGAMCESCLFGRHPNCSDPDCGCIHREIAPLAILAAR